MLPTQADVIAAARRDQLDHDWVPLPGVEGVEVSRDAARLDGLRVPVTSATAELIAAEWGAELPTPATHDLRHAAAYRTVPITWDYRTMHTEEAARSFSQAIDEQLPGGEARPLVSCVGKVWARTAALEERRRAEPHLACNYGLFLPHAPYDSVLRVGKLYQQPGYRHDDAHTDYSQTLQLVRVAPGYEQPSHDGLTGRAVTAGSPIPRGDPSPMTREDDMLPMLLAALGFVWVLGGLAGRRRT